MQKSVVVVALLALLFAPAFASAADATTPQELQITGSAVIEGQSVPVHALVSTGQKDIELSATKTEGSTPVTITVYLATKPKPVATNNQAAAVESSRQIQDGIAGVSPQTAQVVAPFFTLVDSARDKAAVIVSQQLDKTKAGLGTDAGKVLGAETTKNAASNPSGTFWYILQTLYLYILTVLNFIIGSAGVFYPLLAVVALYLLWRLFNRFRRPAY